MSKLTLSDVLEDGVMFYAEIKTPARKDGRAQSRLYIPKSQMQDGGGKLTDGVYKILLLPAE